MSAPVMTELKRTPLYPLHTELGASMTPFAGYQMPVRYHAGILKEHLHVRQPQAFSISRTWGRSKSGQKTEANQSVAQALESRRLHRHTRLWRTGRQRYALLLNDNGGIRDDLMIANLGDRHIIVANAACKDDDESYLRAALAGELRIKLLDDRALLALQGPLAENALAELMPDVREMRFLDVRAVRAARYGLRRLAFRIYGRRWV